MNPFMMERGREGREGRLLDCAVPDNHVQHADRTRCRRELNSETFLSMQGFRVVANAPRESRRFARLGSFIRSSRNSSA